MLVLLLFGIVGVVLICSSVFEFDVFWAFFVVRRMSVLLAVTTIEQLWIGFTVGFRDINGAFFRSMTNMSAIFVNFVFLFATFDAAIRQI